MIWRRQTKLRVHRTPTSWYPCCQLVGIRVANQLVSVLPTSWYPCGQPVGIRIANQLLSVLPTSGCSRCSLPLLITRECGTGFQGLQQAKQAGQGKKVRTLQNLAGVSNLYFLSPIHDTLLVVRGIEVHESPLLGGPFRPFLNMASCRNAPDGRDAPDGYFAGYLANI